MEMKRLFILTAAVIAGVSTVLVSCGISRQSSVASRNDVLSLEPVAKGKTPVTVRTEFNINMGDFEKAIESQFPDVDIIIRFHATRETQYELHQSLLSGTAEDIILSPNMPAVKDIARDTLFDLSGESFTDNYTGSLIASCEKDGRLYYLPGPSDTYGILYDKTLVREHGWQIPHSYTEFITLCRTI